MLREKLFEIFNRKYIRQWTMWNYNSGYVVRTYIRWPHSIGEWYVKEEEEEEDEFRYRGWRAEWGNKRKEKSIG